MAAQQTRVFRCFFSLALAFASVLEFCETARPQDWPQWRGPLGQGTTSAKNLPPVAGSTALQVLWKTPIPGEGCSSPVVCDGRVYLTTAYEGSQRHEWDLPAFWASVILASAVAGLALVRCMRMIPTVRSTSRWGFVVGVWTMAVVALTAVVLAKPLWFWQFLDPWSGTTLAPAELQWVESLNLRPAIVFVCGSLTLIFARLAGHAPVKTAPPLLTQWIGVVTLSVTVACSVLLGLIAGRPDLFFHASQPWLAWLVTGGLGLLALAGSIGWLGAYRKTRLLLAGVGFALAGWLFCNTPGDEFFNPLSLQNRITFLVPAVTLLVFHAWGGVRGEGRGTSALLGSRPSPLVPLITLLVVIVFVRANYLQPQTGVVRAVVCIDAASGELLWDTPVFVAPPEKHHSLNSLATPTPACDAERVYAYFGSGLAALDKDGRILWLKRDADFAGFIRYGAGSSVVLAGDRIVIYRDSEFMGHGDHLEDNIEVQTNRRPTALTAYDKRTGAEVWSIAPPFSHDSYMTPLVWTRDDQPELVVATWKTLAGFAVSDGSLRWTHPYPMQQVVPSPAVNGDCLIVTGGNLLPGPIMAVRAPSAKAKETTPAQTVWFSRMTGSNIVSPVCWDGLLFSVSYNGILMCRDAESGQIHWKERLESRCLASLAAGDGKVYVLEQFGILRVFAADPTATELASLALRETCSATPAIAGGVLFVRTSGHLCCIGSGD